MQVIAKTFSSDVFTYSGPTYIGIQSAKHLGSRASNHLTNMKQIRELPEFKRSFKNSKNKEKPIMIVTVDGGPDENPRYEITISCAVDYFNTYDLDAFFLVTNIPGHSAFNRVERRMAARSKELGGVSPEHKHFGVHLDDKGNANDPQLELKNFEHTEKILREISSGMVIDGYPVIAEHIGEKASEIVRDVSEKWISSHVRSY